MKYSKRHYEDVAKILQQFVNKSTENSDLEVVADFVELFAKDNTRFNTERFMSVVYKNL